MSNYVSLELARGRRKVPAYTSFIVPDVSADPRAIASKDRQAAVSRWRASARQAKRGVNPHACLDPVSDGIFNRG